MARKPSKSKAAKKLSPLEEIRSETLYSSARGWLGTPFMILGMLCILGALITIIALVTTTDSDGSFAVYGKFGLLVAGAVQFISGLFCFGIAALGAAVFDMADCALRNDVRSKNAEAREAYRDYKIRHPEAS